MKGIHFKLYLLVLVKITLAEPQCSFAAALSANQLLKVSSCSSSGSNPLYVTVQQLTGKAGIKVWLAHEVLQVKLFVLTSVTCHGSAWCPISSDVNFWYLFQNWLRMWPSFGVNGSDACLCSLRTDSILTSVQFSLRGLSVFSCRDPYFIP